MYSLLTNKIVKQTALLLFVFALGFFAQWGLSILSTNQTLVDSPLREVGKYKLISPLLLCGNTQPKDFGEFKSLHDTLESIVNDAKSTGKVSQVSIYFRGFGGKWVGINENVSYAPASLFKVPILTAYLKLAETDPSIMDKKFTYDGSFDGNANETFKSGYDIKPGVYKVSDLLKAMIVNSDNNAMTLLTNALPSHSLSEIYTDLGLQVPEDDTPTADIISAKEYSYFFRILYNATYLSPESSEKALEMLSMSDFPQGLRGGVPKDISIAQKFGERTVLDLQGVVLERDLHDCGIIYHPNYPYLLCVMTRGKDYKDLSDVIHSISTVVYEKVSSEK